MISEAQDTLLSLAEVAIALAGFSAIVVVLRRRDGGRWRPLDADMFHGMVIHSVFAVVFCLLPIVLEAFTSDGATALSIASVLLGIQICVHAVGVMMLKTTQGWARGALALGVAVGLCQFLVFTEPGRARHVPIYLGGVIWHVLQAGMLFVLLVWIRSDDIESAPD